jgi:hypothetical protein
MKLILAIILTFIFSVKADAAGVTIITHGYELDSEYPTWVTAMADAIPSYDSFPGTNFTVYKVTLTSDGSNFYYQWQRTNGSPPSVTDSGEIIIELDWSQLDGGIANDYDFSTSVIAPLVDYVIMQTNVISELNGHALAEYPIHLIGHSRGGSLMNEISRTLGTNGLWIDHLTTLDPHPLNNDGNIDPGYPMDASATNTYENVLFHDNYWQDTGLGALFGDPDGEQTAGAYNRLLSGVELDGGYNAGSIFNDSDHSNVHLWYHGTVDLNTPASDTGATITSTERENWWVDYEQEGTNAGFEYSLIGGGDRMSQAIPLGLPSDPAIVDGYNQYWDLGAGIENPNRTALPANNGTWPNIIKFDVLDTNSVIQGDLIATKLYYQYAGTSNLTMQVYFDRDFNPYNSNSFQIVSLQPPATGEGSVYYYSDLGLTTTNVPPGTYSIYAKISDGLHTRYLYTPEVVQVLSSQPTLDITRVGSSQTIIGVNGVPGQNIILQVSDNLQNWTPLSTNTLNSNRITYTNSMPFYQLFYRAVINPGSD